MRRTFLSLESKFMFAILSVFLLMGCSNFDNNEVNKSVKKENKQVEIEENNSDINISENEIMKTIKDITQNKRVLGTDGEKKQADYLKNKMKGYGYNVEYQDFEVFNIGQEGKYLINDIDINVFLNINPLSSTESKGMARNVIAKNKNFDKNKKTLYLVSHYDSTKNTTGVYDNATGISAVVELARVLSNYNYKDFNIVFALFSAEEYYKMGSRYYMGQLSESDRENILGAINVDMIGYKGFQHSDFPIVGDIKIHLTPWIKKDPLEALFNDRFNNKYKVDNEMGGMSDDISFARLGVPTIYFADENFSTGFEIEEKSTDVQLEPLKVDVISNLCEDIVDIIKNFDMNKFNKLNSLPDEEKGVYGNS